MVLSFGADGQIEAIAGSSRDITERHESRAALEKANTALDHARAQLSGAPHMDRLVHDLLAYTRLAANENEVHQPVNAEIVFQKVSSSLQATFQSSGAFVSHAPLPSVRVEEMHVQQLFQNLIGNAIKYRSEDVPRIHVSATRQKPLWRFAVEDNGIGIQSQFAEQVFGPFKRLHSKDAYEGSGIGLAICQKIVNYYGGRIWVESEPGCGSTFFFTLPV